MPFDYSAAAAFLILGGLDGDDVSSPSTPADPAMLSEGFVLHSAYDGSTTYGYSATLGTIDGTFLPGHTLTSLTSQSSGMSCQLDNATITAGTAADVTALMSGLQLVLTPDHIIDLRNFMVPNGFQIISGNGYDNYIDTDYLAVGDFEPYLRTATFTGDSELAYGIVSGAPSYTAHQTGLIQGSELLPGNPLVNSAQLLAGQFDVSFYVGPGATMNATALDTYLSGKSLVLGQGGTSLMTKTFATATKAFTGFNNAVRRYRWSSGAPTLSSSPSPFDVATATFYTLAII